MIVKNIYYSKRYQKNLRNLPKSIIKIAIQKEKIFRINPLHPSLKLHGLKGNLEGIWSIYINKKYRILFIRKASGDILFFNIGKHEIYNEDL